MQTKSVYTQNIKKPLISFIITYHNEPLEMLQECLQSILSLTLTRDEREIIIVDDGSDESPLEALRDVRNDILYIRQNSQGLSMARNQGIDISKGEFIQFVDADDFLVISQYENCLDLVRFNSPDMVLFNSTSTANEKSPFLYSDPVSGAEYMRHNNLRASVCGYIFRKSLLLSLRFTKNLTHEDEEFTPKLFLRAETVFDTNANAYFYRIRTDSIMHRRDETWIRKRLADQEKIIRELYLHSELLTSGDRLALQRRVIQLTMDYIYNIIVLTHDKECLNEAIDKLSRLGLFPLPDKDYTRKYKIFRKLANNKLGRDVLMILLKGKS